MFEGEEKGGAGTNIRFKEYFPLYSKENGAVTESAREYFPLFEGLSEDLWYSHLDDQTLAYHSYDKWEATVVKENRLITVKFSLEMDPGEVADIAMKIAERAARIGFTVTPGKSFVVQKDGVPHRVLHGEKAYSFLNRRHI